MQQEQNNKSIFEALERMRSAKATEPEKPSPALQFSPLHLAAAVREEFTVDSIREDAGILGMDLEEEEPEAALDGILERSEFIFGKGTTMKWRLQEDRRTEVLHWFFAGPEAPGPSLAMLKPAHTSEAFLLEMLDGRTPDWSQMTDVAVLRLLLRNIDRLDGVVPTPDRREVENRIVWLETMRPFYQLTENFRGRKDELRRLREYIDHLPSQSGREMVKRQVFRGMDYFRNLLSLRDHPLLVISGIGGVGKSALVARFILDHVGGRQENVSNDGLIFVYIDFDHGTVSLREPLDILCETARQLALQIPDRREEFGQLEREVREVARSIHSGRSTRSSGDWYRGSFAPSKSQMKQQYRSGVDEREQLLLGFGQVWSGLSRELQEAPMMLVLDSFEEVHRLGSGVVQELFHFLEDWSEILPRFRPVLVGRTPVEGLPIKPESLDIKEFDRESAIAYLQARGVEEKELAEQVVREFGRQPLTLKLAAGYIRSQSPSREDLRNPSKKGLFFKQIDAARAQNELFQRNLDHIGDQDARKIAFPGLVVRAVSPEVIREVLAGPCRLGQVPEEESRRLFRVLAGETFLVRESGEWEIQFRKDLRQTILPMVLQKEPARTAAIHEAAIAFYGQKTEPAQRAEYIYHCLMRGDEPRHFEKELQQPGMSDLLVRSLDELPTRAHVFLANLWRLNLSPEIKRLADLEDWEENLARELDEINGAGFLEESLRLYADRLHERTDRSRLSPLPVRETRLWLEMNELNNAKDALEHAEKIEAMRDDPEGMMHVLGLRSMLLERMGDYAGAVAAAWDIITRTEDHWQGINGLAAWLRLVYRAGVESTISEKRIRTVTEKALAALNSPETEGYIGARLVRNFLLPLRAMFGSGQPVDQWKALLPAIGRLRGKEFDKSYGAPNLEEALSLFMGAPEEIGRLRFYLRKEEFERLLAATRSAFPDYSTLSDACMKVFQERLGNVVSSNIYETALYEFVLAAERYGRLEELEWVLPR